MAWTIEGALVRDWCEYEYDNLMVGGEDLLRFIVDNLGPGVLTDLDPNINPGWRERTDLGRVRITIERA